MATAYGNEAWKEINSNYPEYEELNEDERLQVNHATCIAGQDTRKRFGLKRVDGAYLYHCFNCGESGYWRPRETLSRILSSTKVDTGTDSKHKCGVDYFNSETNYDKFDIRGQLWLGQYGFNKYLCTEYGIRESHEGVILPVHTPEGFGKDYQVRRYTKLPKYVTHRVLKNAQVLHKSTSKPVVIVEDLLSSYKLHAAGFTTVCLMGTSLNKTTLTETGLDRTKRVVIWLDDDEAGHVGAAKLFRELSPLFSTVTSINMAQPKEIEMDDLLTMDL